jgi:hypothetical protein
VEPDFRKPAWHIASYPRSGSDLVRTLLETYSGRPTMGCPRSGKKDLPMLARKTRDGDSQIEITDPDPVGYTSHRPSQIMFHRAHVGAPLGFLLLTRNPRAAIPSKLLREHKGFAGFSPLRQRRLIDAEIDLYLGVVTFFASEPSATKFHLRYEDLVSKAWQETHLAGTLAQLTGAHTDKPIKVPPDSSPKAAGQDALKAGIADRVARSLTYEDVMEIIVHNS